jgi:molybdate transport system ATP-binding protein
MTLDVDVRVRRDGFDVEAAFTAGADSTVALLGPNGSGKSTVVHALAGLVDDVSGRIQLDGTDLIPLPVERRPVGIVFQELRLFPHLSALENAAFPLRASGVRASEARERAGAMLDGLGLPEERRGAKSPRLSGGEAQRVALARALIAEPRLLLLDEPTSALDVQARARLRPVIRQSLTSFPGIRVLVTHDPVEAMTMADRLVVLEEGRVTQAGTPEDLRTRPQTPYVADLVGLNLYRGRLQPLEPGAGTLVTDRGELIVAWPAEAVTGIPADAVATLRPADVVLHTSPPDAGSARNVVSGIVDAIAIDGERARVRIDARPSMVAEVTLGSVDRLQLREGSQVWASCKAVEVRVQIVDASAA